MWKRYGFALTALIAGVSFEGCSSSESDDTPTITPEPVTPTQAPTQAPTPTQVPTPTAAPTPDFSDPVVKGEYIARAQLGCDGCHTPRLPTGEPDMDKYMSGVDDFLDLDPEDTEIGNVPAPNLTNDATGLADWTDEEIKRAFLEGISRDGRFLVPIMPYYIMHNMLPEDADAIVAYLRTVEGIEHTVPPRQALPFNMPGPAQPVPESAIPESTLPSTDARYESARRGRYVAGLLGSCMDCHTAYKQGQMVPIDLENLFAGGRVFTSTVTIGAPDVPAMVYSTNITPDATGIQGWTAEQVVTLLREGVDNEGNHTCAPMAYASGPIGPFSHLTEQDVQDIATYITTIPANANSIAQECSVSGQ